MKFPTPRVLAAVLGIGIACSFIIAPHSFAVDETEPVIQQVRGRAVTVTVPEGFQQVVLQQLVSPRKGKAGRQGGAAAVPEWRTLATKFPNGEAATFTIRLAKLTAKRNLRVVGSRGQALPETLLTDVVSFDPESERFQIDGTAPVSLGDAKLGTVNSFSNSVLSTNLVNGASGSAVESREVAESDIWKLSGDRLYFFNQTRGLQIFDLQNPDDPALAGTLRLPGAGDQMYLLGQEHAVLLTRQSYWWNSRYVVFGMSGGNVIDEPIVALDRSSTTTLALTASSSVVSNAVSTILPTRRGFQENEMVVVKTASGAPEIVGRVPYNGYLQESRLVGSVLYVVTATYEKPAGSTNEVYGSKLISVDLSNPANPVQRDSIFFPGWQNTVTATDRYLFLAHAAEGGNKVEVIDISSPIGTMVKRTPVDVSGYIGSKFQLHLEDDTFTAVSQVWRENPDATSWRRTIPVTQVTSYSLVNPDAPVKLGSVEFAPGETIRATRFDNGRAYVVTFVQQDPLWVVKVRSGAAPKVLGHVEVPGFSTYIEPLDDRLVTVGFVNGEPAVSLFDVTDPSAPKVLSQVPVNDSGWAYSEATWNEKAFTVLPEENLIMLPFSRISTSYASGVQLFDLLPNAIVKRGAITHDFYPRRATVVHDRIVAISQTNLISVDATNRDVPKITADLEISWPVDRVILAGDYLLQIGAANTGPAGSTLTISPADNPEESLATVKLDGQPVVGATVKDGVLYVVQAPRSRRIFYGVITFNAVQTAAQSEPQELGSLTLFDVSKLPEVSKIGATTFPAETGYSAGEGRCLWVNPTTLLWVQDLSPYYLFTIDWQVQAISTDRIATDGFVPSPRGIIPGSKRRLSAFDVTSPATPKLASTLQFGFAEPWDVGGVVTVNGSVFFSYKHLGWLSGLEGGVSIDEAKRRDPVAFSEIERLRNRHFLQVIDYGDPAAPFVHERRVNIPGQLAGISNSGRLLFTYGQQYKAGEGKSKGTGAAVHVSAFDGTAAHLVDQLPLSQSWQPFLIADETIALLHPEPSVKWVESSNPANSGYLPNANQSRLEFWSVGVDGKLGKLDTLELDHETGLSAVRNLWVLSDYGSDLRLLDARNPKEVIDLGAHSYDGWIVPNLKLSDGDATRGLWLPLGTYGVESILLTP